MKITVYKLTLFIGLAIMIYFYLFNFDNYSETELVRFSFIWFPLIAFTFFGWVGKVRNITHRFRFAMLSMIFSTALLIVFFELIFPEL